MSALTPTTEPRQLAAGAECHLVRGRVTIRDETPAVHCNKSARHNLKSPARENTREPGVSANRAKIMRGNRGGGELLRRRLTPGVHCLAGQWETGEIQIVLPDHHRQTRPAACSVA